MRWRGRIVPCAAALWAAAALSGAVMAQETAPPAAQPSSASEIRTPFATLDRERLYAESEPGKAAQSAFDRDSAALIAENRRLEAALEEEERNLTERRKTMPPDEFRKLADEFDTKVEDLRKAQDAKTRALTRKKEEAKQLFFEKAVPVLGQLMVDLNVLAIVDRSAIILTFDQLDITDMAIARLNETFAAEPPAPETGDTKPASP